MSRACARRAVQGLIDEGKFDTGNETEEGGQHNEGEIIRELLLHDPELQHMVRTRVAELCKKRKEAGRLSMMPQRVAGDELITERRLVPLGSCRQRGLGGG